MVIPPEVLANAKGLAVITVLKAGFLFSGRAGSGVIVARLPDGGWSAPSAIVTAGAGVGGQIGAELTDFVFILNNRAAVESFSQAGSITLGGNVSLAAGPLGRNAEAAGSASLKSVAAIFSYSKTKGLFAGISLEGSILVERREANRKFYGNNCTAKTILGGRVDPPPECDVLFRVLESRAFRSRSQSFNGDDFYDDIPDEFSDSDGNSTYNDHSSSRRRGNGQSRGYYDDEDDFDDDRRRDNRDRERDRDRDDTYSGRSQRTQSSWEDDVYDRPAGRSSRRVNRDDDNVEDLSRNLQKSHFNSTYSDNPGRPSAPKPDFNRSSPTSYSRSNTKRFDSDAPSRYDRERQQERSRETERRNETQEKGAKAVALYSFEGEQNGDLSFKKGDIITIVKRSESKDDWWTGKRGGLEGIFPANYVEMV